MKISAIHTQNINFTSNTREKYKTIDNHVSKELEYRNTTSFFRNDINWNKFISFLDKKYKNVDKVNIYCEACSDGSEPFSLAMKLISDLGEEKAQKFLPIIAKDIDEDIIKLAKSGYIYHERGDFFNTEYNTKDINDFIDVEKRRRIFIKELYSEKNVYPIKDILKNAVVFDVGNIQNDIKNMKPDNSFVMFRNVWPYLEMEDRIDIVDKLKKQLGKNSYVMLGSYDEYSDNKLNDVLTKAPHYLMMINGFKEEDSPLRIYSAPQKPSTENFQAYNLIK